MDFVYDSDGRYTLNGTAYNDLSSFFAAAGGSFSRASTATYFNSAGVLQTAAVDAPRFTYEPITHAPQGILLEESRTNILRYSSDISTGWSVRPGLTKTLNAAVAPNGANEAALIQIAAGSDKYVSQSNTQTMTNGQSWTFSVWLWSNTVSTVKLYLYASSPLTNVASSFKTITSTPQRFSITLTLAGLTTETSLFTRVDTEDAGGEVNTGDFYMWGAQLEQGKFPTSYIPTTTASVTRAADVMSVPLGAWFSASTGTFFADATPYNANSIVQGAYSPSIAAIVDAGGLYVSRLGRTQGTPGQGLYQSSACGFTALGAWANGTSSKIAGTYAANSMAAVLAANPLATCTTSTVTTGMSVMNIGNYYSGQGYWSSTIAKLKYYPARVSDTQLQLLTQ
jgi:hypothetical protein